MCFPTLQEKTACRNENCPFGWKMSRGNPCQVALKIKSVSERMQEKALILLSASKQFFFPCLWVWITSVNLWNNYMCLRPEKTLSEQECCRCGSFSWLCWWPGRCYCPEPHQVAEMMTFKKILVLPERHRNYSPGWWCSYRGRSRLHCKTARSKNTPGSGQLPHLQHPWKPGAARDSTNSRPVCWQTGREKATAPYCPHWHNRGVPGAETKFASQGHSSGVYQHTDNTHTRDSEQTAPSNFLLASSLSCYSSLKQNGSLLYWQSGHCNSLQVNHKPRATSPCAERV